MPVRDGVSPQAAGGAWTPLVLVALGLGLGACGPGMQPSALDSVPSSLREEAQALSERRLPLRVAVVGSAAKVRPHEKVTGAQAASLIAARNEFESFQVVVSADEAPLRGLNVELKAPLVGPRGFLVPESNVTVYRAGYYTVATASDLEGAPGRWPDPLIPSVDPLVGERRNAFPVDVPVGENRVAWIDVLVPNDAPPGTYEGLLEVSAEGRVAEVPVQLRVLNHTLPSTTTLKGAFGLSSGHGCRELGLSGCDRADVRDAARSLFVRSALDNRITIPAPQGGTIETADGLASFRKHLLPFVHGTAPTRLPGARLSAFQAISPKNRQLSVWRRFIEKEGFADRAYAYVCDEPHFFPVYGDSNNNWRYCKAEIDIAKSVWPEVPKLVTAHIQSSEKAGTTSLVDIMVIGVELLDGPKGTVWHEGNQRPLYEPFLSSRERPKEVWLYAACGSHGCTKNNDPYTTGWAGYEIDAPASQTRAMAWIAWRYALQGTLYFDTVGQLGNAWVDQYQFTGNGEGNLFYPGTPERIGGKTPIPIESIRMKLVRDGYEDYELLHFLRQNGKGSEAEEIARALFPAPYDTARTDEEVQQARNAVAELVAELTTLPDLVDEAPERPVSSVGGIASGGNDTEGSSPPSSGGEEFFDAPGCQSLPGLPFGLAPLALALLSRRKRASRADV